MPGQVKYLKKKKTTHMKQTWKVCKNTRAEIKTGIKQKGWKNSFQKKV